MRRQPFQSEFPPEAMPSPTGDPMHNAVLDDKASQADRWILVQRAQQVAVLEAVHGFYLAKRFTTEITGFTGWTNKVAASAVEELERRLWRLAVIDVAKVNDRTGLSRAASLPGSRVASLPGVLKSMKETLEASNDPAAAADLAKVEALRASINPDTQLSLQYIRHVRNKWAGHPSMDRDFDSWADADQHLSIPLLENGLALLVRVHQEAADLVAASTVLGPQFAVPQPDPEVVETADGTVERFPMTVAWENVTVMAEAMRKSAGREASALRDQLTSPPGYGSADDTDWSPGSEHSALRAAVDLRFAAEHRSPT